MFGTCTKPYNNKPKGTFILAAEITSYTGCGMFPMSMTLWNLGSLSLTETGRSSGETGITAVSPNLISGIISGQNVRKISQREDVMPTERYMIDYRTGKPDNSRPRSYAIPPRIMYLFTATPILNKAGEIDYIIYSIGNYSGSDAPSGKASQSTMRAMALESSAQYAGGLQHWKKTLSLLIKAMYNIYGKALRLAPTSASVMLTGESGTGKDVLARFIHKASLRRHENFIHVNMATIPKPLFESGYLDTLRFFYGAARQGKRSPDPVG